MKTPRISGAALAGAAHLATTPLGRVLLRRQMQADFGMEHLVSLPPEARALLDDMPRPRQGAPPRRWADAGLPAPAPGRRQGARDLTSAYRDGRLSPVEVLQAFEARARSGAWGESTYSPLVNLAIDVAAARASEQRWRRGEPLGPLDGVPVPVKDHQPIAGVPCRGGTAYFEEPAPADGYVTATLRAAGALVCATTHCTEWGMAPTGINPHFDMPRNPYSRRHAAGGSSTGSGVAASLGLAPVTLGSDGGGSIRIPAAVNGVFGIKPTYTRLGRTGDRWGNGSVATMGPIGQTTESLVDFMEHFGRQHDPADPVNGWAPIGDAEVASWRASLGRGVRGCRLGLWTWAWKRADRRIAEVCRRAVEALEREGAILVDVDVPLAEYHEALGAMTIGVETMGSLTDTLPLVEDRTGLDLLVVLRALETVSAREFLLAARTRAQLRHNAAAALCGVDVLCAPCTDLAAPDYSLHENRRHLLDTATTAAMCRFAFFANLTGLPAASVPAGMLDGLPVGLQIIGDAWDEASVLAVMAHAERIGFTSIPAPPGFEAYR
jgi:aspartyl-tRNA(Asn)/glutamyl-tRNA(Gln) amidotransferase subunit A